MGQAQINVRTRACSRTSIARTRQAALTHNVRGKELKDETVLKRMKEVLFPKHLMDSIKALTSTVDTLTREIGVKNATIKQLEERVDCLEDAPDGVEQYSRRPNLRFFGIAEKRSDYDTDKLITTVINESMKLQPPMLQEHLERSHRLGPKLNKDGQQRNRVIIVRFRSEKLRDTVYKSRFQLKEHNERHPENKIFIHEDLNARRAALARLTRTLKEEAKLNDCWTANGNVLIKDLHNKIYQVRHEADLSTYWTDAHMYMYMLA